MTADELEKNRLSVGGFRVYFNEYWDLGQQF